MTTVPHTSTARPAGERTRVAAWLRTSATVFTVAVLVHNFDHVRRGVDALPADVFWSGTLAILVEVGVVWLVFADHRMAPAACSAAGLALAAGYLAVHFTPSRSWLSDAYPGSGVDWFSWFAASCETAAALALGAAGLLAIRRAGGLERSLAGPPTSRGRMARALTHPVVAAAAVGNAVILVVSLLAW
jgi:hypothetical protein